MVKFVKICPKCGSINIKSSTGRYALEAEDFRDNCRDCGYEGIIPEVDEKKIKEFRKEINQ